MFTASFKSWALPAQTIRADSRNAGSSPSGNATFGQCRLRLSDFMHPFASKASIWDFSGSESGRFSGRGGSEFLDSLLRISEEFQRFYRSCLSNDFVEAWMKSYRPILARSDETADQVAQETKQRRSATA